MSVVICDQIKEDKIGTHRRNVNYLQNFGTWEDNIRMDLKGWEIVDLVHLVQGRDHWQALVNLVMNLWIP
jgi:hypothetical protein